MLNNVRRLPAEVLERFLECRDAKKCGIQKDLANYILQINDAFILHKQYRSVTTCAEVFRRKWQDLSLSTCKTRIYDSISFFNSGSTVTASEWNNYFADLQMDLADACMTDHDWNGVDRAWTKARNWRLEAAKNIIDPERQRFRWQLVSPDLTSDRMGVKGVGLLNAYKEGLEIIASRDASQADKDRLTKDLSLSLGVGDYVNFEEMLEEDEQD